MATTVTINANYAGEHAGNYIGAALRAAKSLDYITVLENVKYKRNLTTVATADMIKDATCNFTDEGTLTLTDSILDPKEFQINAQICKKDLLEDWQAAQMKSSAWNRDMSNDFSAFLVSRLSGQMAQFIEDNVWNGQAAANSFQGFSHAAGTLSATATQIANAGGAANPYTSTNVLTELSNIVANIPSAVYGTEDLYVYVSNKTYQLYISAAAAAGYMNLSSMNDKFVPMFEGVKLAVCPGMQDDTMVAARKSNLFFGTDLLSDTTTLKILDMADLDGSDNIRLVAKFTAGVQSMIGGDIVQMD